MKLDLQFDERFDHPIDAVWRAVTDPRLLARWLMDNDFEPRLGHAFTLHDPPTPAWRGWVECEVLELDPPRRMVWSWHGGMVGEAPSRVIFELRPEGRCTHLVFRHEGDAPPAQRESLRAGWTRKLAQLRQVPGPDYARRIAFRAPRERVCDAISTLDGLRGWWTTIVGGSAAAGDELRLGYAGLDESITMRVDDASRPASLQWTCLAHIRFDDWNGTRVTFDLVEREAETCELSFRHVGLAPDLACCSVCEPGWDRFLASLAGYIERGEGAPFGA